MTINLIYILVLLFILGVPFWNILIKAGYSPWWALTMFVPILNIIMLWIFANSEWPILKQQQDS
jgi:hypothetical protein